MREKDCNFATNTVLRIYLRDVRVYRTFPVALTSEASVRLQVCDPTRAQGARLAGNSPEIHSCRVSQGPREESSILSHSPYKNHFGNGKGNAPVCFSEKWNCERAGENESRGWAAAAGACRAGGGRPRRRGQRGAGWTRGPERRPGREPQRRVRSSGQRPPVGPRVRRGPRRAALSASAFPPAAASGSAPGPSGRAADNL